MSVLTQPQSALFAKRYDPNTGEVHVTTRLTLSDYERATPAHDWASLKAFAGAMRDKKLIFINATLSGGGVAIMRAPLTALLRMLGVDVHWYVLQPDAAAFLVTKEKFHNILQKVAKPGARLDEADMAVYEGWSARNAVLLTEALSSADVIVLDDWQTAGLIRFIKGDDDQPGLNPDAKLLFRDHIHTEGDLMVTEGTPQHTTWDYLWRANRICDADMFVTHPVPDFVPPNVPDSKVVYMPATCDLLDDLNRRLNADEIAAGLAFVNDQLALNEGQLPLSPERPFMVLFARFDPAKGMPNMLKYYRRSREIMHERGLTPEQMPQLVLAGNGSVDDPDGVRCLAEVMQLRATEYADIADDIKVVRMPANDLAVNALLGLATLGLQPSLKEGFEDRVTSLILHGVPVLGSDRGGIPLQIREGHSGFVIDPDDTEQWAATIAEIMCDGELLEYLRVQTTLLAATDNYEFTTVPNAMSWLYLAIQALTNPDFTGDRRWVRHLTLEASVIS